MRQVQNGKQMQSSDGITHEEHQVTFNGLDSSDRLKEFLPYLPQELAAFASVTTTCWAVSEILIAIFENRPSVASLASPIIAAGAIVSIYRAYKAYRTYVPEALIGESRKAKSIYYARSYGWQWGIAVEMLWDRVRPVDAELERVRRGAEFVRPKRLPNKEYFEWLRSRPDAITRLIRAVTAQCTRDVPLAIGAAISEEQLKGMSVQIEALSDLYKTTALFERECHAIVPPEDFEKVHEMTHGWTDAIREGVHQFINIATELGHLDKKKIKDVASGEAELPAFTIKFDSPENMDNFCARLDEVDPSVLSE